MIAIKTIVTIPREDDPLGKKAEEWAEGYRESGLLEKFSASPALRWRLSPAALT